MKKVLTLLLSITVICSLFAASYVSAADNYVVDISAVELTSYDTDPNSIAYVAETPSGPMIQMGYNSFFSVGKLDLSKYKSVAITYGTPAAFDADADGNTCIIGLKSEASSYGWHGAAEYNLSGNLGYDEMIEVKDPTADFAETREAVIDLSDIDYSGEVYVTSYASNGHVQGVFAVEFIASDDTGDNNNDTGTGDINNGVGDTDGDTGEDNGTDSDIYDDDEDEPDDDDILDKDDDIDNVETSDDSTVGFIVLFAIIAMTAVIFKKRKHA